MNNPNISFRAGTLLQYCYNYAALTSVAEVNPERTINLNEPVSQRLRDNPAVCHLSSFKGGGCQMGRRARKQIG